MSGRARERVSRPRAACWAVKERAPRIAQRWVHPLERPGAHFTVAGGAEHGGRQARAGRRPAAVQEECALCGDDSRIIPLGAASVGRHGATGLQRAAARVVWRPAAKVELYAADGEG